MKKLLLLLFLLPVFCKAQVPKGLIMMKLAAERSYFDNSSMDLWLLYNKVKYKPKTKLELKTIFESYLSQPVKPTDTIKEISARIFELKKNTVAINKYLDGLNNYGKTEASFYCENELPFEFVQFHEMLCFHQSKLCFGSVFNTMRTDADSRAITVAKEGIFPGLVNFLPLLDNKEINFVAITVTYFSKDFSNHSDVLNREPETLTAIFPVDVLLKFTNAEISEKELFTKTTFLSHDRNMEPAAIKLIVLNP